MLFSHEFLRHRIIAIGYARWYVDNQHDLLLGWRHVCWRLRRLDVHCDLLLRWRRACWPSRLWKRCGRTAEGPHRVQDDWFLAWWHAKAMVPANKGSLSGNWKFRDACLKLATDSTHIVEPVFWGQPLFRANFFPVQKLARIFGIKWVVEPQRRGPSIHLHDLWCRNSAPRRPSRRELK